MIDEAIKQIGGHKGCSQIALENYILAAYKKLNYKRHFLRASVKRGKANGTFLVHHNHKNSIKLPPKKKKTYGKMIEEAINFIGGNKGCSEIALENYILASYKKINYKRRFLRTAITQGKATGVFIVHHKHKNKINLSPTKPMKPKKRKRQTGETESPKKIKLSPTKSRKPKKRKRQTETELSPRNLRSFRKNSSSTLVSFICLFLVYHVCHWCSLSQQILDAPPPHKRRMALRQIDDEHGAARNVKELFCQFRETSFAPAVQELFSKISRNEKKRYHHHPLIRSSHTSQL